MAHCEDCSGCGGCGQASQLVLTQPELDFLRKLGQIPFLPVARRWDDPAPVYLEDGAQDYTPILQCLEKKGLISLDYDKPLRGFDSQAYAAYPLRGSMALTERGHRVLELVETQGITEESD